MILSSKIANCTFKSPILTASGTYGYGDEVKDLVNTNPKIARALIKLGDNYLLEIENIPQNHPDQ